VEIVRASVSFVEEGEVSKKSSRGGSSDFLTLGSHEAFNRMVNTDLRSASEWSGFRAEESLILGTLNDLSDTTTGSAEDG
jgi:hypothetical protein